MAARIFLFVATRVGSLALAGFLAAALTTACGRSDLPFDDADGGVFGGGGGDYDAAPVPPPASCGDGVCGAGETCTNCPQDCSVCATCGDGFCRDGETCESCAPDCGKCASCGNGKCEPPNETCFTCPEDCGACKGCGDGLCRAPETCASCPHDCGVCAVCGNHKCEGPYETCTNCHQDCGDCPPVGCFQMLGCAQKCIDFSTRPPNVKVSCVADCVAQGCPSAQFFFDQAFNCFLQHFGECRGGDFGCLQKKCDSEVAACIGSKCN